LASSKEDASSKFEIKVEYLNINVCVESLAEGHATHKAHSQ
jgi:hypothetical protein